MADMSANVAEGARATARRGVLRSSASLVGGLVLLVGFVLSADHFGADSDALRADGGRTRGQIVDLRQDNGVVSGNAQIRYEVDGVVLTRPVDLGADADGYRSGQDVTVYFDRDEPTHMTIDDEDNQPGWTVLPMIVALVGGLGAAWFGVAGSTHWSRVRRTVRRGDWHRCDLDMRPTRRRKFQLWSPRPAVLDQTDASPDRQSTGAAISFVVTGWPESGADVASTDEWWCALDRRRVVFSPGYSDGRQLILAHRPRGVDATP